MLGQSTTFGEKNPETGWRKIFGGKSKQISRVDGLLADLQKGFAM